jgi:hypothetical protein
MKKKIVIKKRKPVGSLPDFIKVDTFKKHHSKGDEVWLRDFIKLKGCSRQAVYEAVTTGKITGLQKYNTLFIIWDDDSKKWFT